MGWIIGKYMGQLKSDFVFIDKDGVKHNFNKCSSDLIEKFNLKGNDSVEQWFIITYFLPRPTNPTDFRVPISIISELEILNEKIN